MIFLCAYLSIIIIAKNYGLKFLFFSLPALKTLFLIIILEYNTNIFKHFSI